MCVAPLLLGFSVAHPFIRQAGAAGKTHCPIHDDKLAMVAMIHAQQLVPLRAVVFHELHSGLFQPFELRLLQLRAAHRVHDQMDLHATLRFLHEQRHELRAEFARAKDEVLHRDRFLRGANGFEHRGENLVAVDQCRDFVAGEERCIHQVPDRFTEGDIFHAVGCFDRFLNRLGHASREEDKDQ